MKQRCVPSHFSPTSTTDIWRIVTRLSKEKKHPKVHTMSLDCKVTKDELGDVYMRAIFLNGGPIFKNDLDFFGNECMVSKKSIRHAIVVSGAPSETMTHFIMGKTLVVPQHYGQ